MQRWHICAGAEAGKDADAAAERVEVMRILEEGGMMGGGGVGEGEVGTAEKRRRFGRFVGLRGCESPEMRGEEEEEARREMERWMEGEMRKREERERVREGWRGKGCW